ARASARLTRAGPGRFTPGRNAAAALMIRPPACGGASNLTAAWSAAGSALGAVVGVVVDAEFLELGAQRLARDAELLRGPGLVARAHPQRVLDRQPLDLDQRAHHAGGKRLAGPRRPGARAAALQLGGQVLGPDLVLGLEQHHPLDHVLQLAHVAGPAV